MVMRVVQDKRWFTHRVWLALVVVVALALSTVVLGTGPARAAGAGTVTKELDATQGVGFTAPRTFQTGSLVRYRLTAQCSSLTAPCGVGTLTDVLDPNLAFVNIPAVSTTLPFGHTYDESSRTLTVTIGSSDQPWLDGQSLEFVIVARVLTAPAAGGVIPNQASLTVTDGPTHQSQVVEIQTPTPTPTWYLTKRQVNANTGAPSSAPIAPGQDVKYTMQFSWPKPTLGSVPVTGGTLVDTYPAGAVVVDAAGGVVDTVNHTITWQVPAMDPATSGNCTGDPNVCLGFSRTITLNFPAAAFGTATTVTNHALGTLSYADGTQGQLPGRATSTFGAAVPQLTTTKTSPTSVNQNGPITWRIMATNTGTVDLHDVTMTDTLPTAGYRDLELVRAQGEPAPGSSYPLTITFRDADGAPLGTPLVLPAQPTWTTYPVPAGAASITMTAAALRVDRFLLLTIRGIVTAPAGTTISNCASTVAAEAEVSTACASSPVIVPNTVLSVFKTHFYSDPAATNVAPGEDFVWGVTFRAVMGTPLTQVTMSDLMPKEFEYGETVCFAASSSGSSMPSAAMAAWAQDCSAGARTEYPLPSESVTVRADGSTSIQWQVTAPPHPNAFPANTFADTWYTVFYTARAKDGTAVANYVNRVAAETTGVRVDCTTKSADAFDLNNNGNATETLCQAQDTVQVRAASVANLYKWVKGNLDSNVLESTGLPDTKCPDWEGYTRYPCVATLSPGGDFDYRLRLVNTGNIPLTNFVAYDILPHAGDTGVSQVLSRTDRGTDWTPHLTGPVSPAEGFGLPASAQVTVEYNLTDDPCRPELSSPEPGQAWQSGCDDTWYSAAEITDWSAVRSFRVTAFTGAAWEPAADVVLSIPMVAPSDAPTSTRDPINLSVAWNSAGHQEFRLNADGSTAYLPASEPRKVGVIVPFVVLPATPTPTPTETVTAAVTPTATAEPTVTPPPTATPSVTLPPAPTQTPTQTPKVTPMPTATRAPVRPGLPHSGA